MAEEKTSAFYEPPAFEFEGTRYELGRLTMKQVLGVARIIESNQEAINRIFQNQQWAAKLGTLVEAESKSRKARVGLDYLRQHSEIVAKLGVDVVSTLLLASEDFLTIIAGLVLVDGEPLDTDAFLSMPIGFQPLVVNALAEHPDVGVFMGNLSPVLSRFNVDMGAIAKAAQTPTKLEQAVNTASAN